MTETEIDSLLKPMYGKPKGERETTAVRSGKTAHVTCDDPSVARQLLRKGWPIARRDGSALVFEVPAKLVSFRTFGGAADPEAESDGGDLDL
jgi:hypothetical protein